LHSPDSAFPFLPVLPAGLLSLSPPLLRNIIRTTQALIPIAVVETIGLLLAFTNGRGTIVVLQETRQKGNIVYFTNITKYTMFYEL
jgi:hypothetical protein